MANQLFFNIQPLGPFQFDIKPFMLALAPIEVPEAERKLVGWWKFDEGSGSTTADSSGNANHGSLHGPVQWTDGHDGKALKFTGPFNYVLVEDSPELNPTDAITIAAWINPSWTGNNRILQKSSGGHDNQYRLLKEFGDNMVFEVSGVANHQLSFEKLPPAGEWTHLAAVYDGSKMTVFYNGEVAGEQETFGKMATSDGPLFIGTKHETAPAGDEFNGILDDVRIYNYALSEADIAALYAGKELREGRNWIPVVVIVVIAAVVVGLATRRKKAIT